jgi:hypothetical protein
VEKPIVGQVVDDFSRFSATLAGSVFASKKMGLATNAKLETASILDRATGGK